MKSASAARIFVRAVFYAILLAALLLPTHGPVTSTYAQGPGIVLAAVPWAGSETKPHAVYSGGQLILQASASLGGNGDPVPLTSGTWDPGDGTGPKPIPVGNSRVLQYTHTYSGSINQPYTATIRIVDTGGNVYTDTFRVQIQPDTPEVRTNMAIDKGLWYLHTQMQRTGTMGFWIEDLYSQNYNEGVTAAAVQALQVNGHRATGDPLTNPYVSNVARGLAFLFDRLRVLSLNNQGTNNPDSDGDGIGLGSGRTTAGDHEAYLGGQVIDAIVASGTPDATAPTGNATWVLGKTYREIVRDMLDAYSWGAFDTVVPGAFYYFFQNNSGFSGGADSSASHWWAIGVLAGQTWGLDAPQWLKDQNRNSAVPHWQNLTSGLTFGRCGYRDRTGTDVQQGANLTAACMIMMNANGEQQTSSRFTAASSYMAANILASRGNFYAMFQLTKAMRTAKLGGVTTPITNLNGTVAWHPVYRDWLLANQQPTGRWDNGNVPAVQLRNSLTTAWGVIILSPALFELGPTASCAVDTNLVCQFGATGGCNADGTNAYSTANFNADDSTAGDNPIASYSWNFADGTPVATGITASHAFATAGTFNVQLTVTDTKGNSDTSTCQVTATSGALSPIANAGGPYNYCPGGTLVLDASASVGRGSNILSYNWDLSSPVNFTPADASGATADVSAHLSALSPGTYDIGLRVTDDSVPAFSSTAFTVVTVRPAGHPSCDQDADGIGDTVDNCPVDPNAGQQNNDGDAQGDACDPDDDNDGDLDPADNCAFVANSNQENHDGDAQGDACDTDDDDDGDLDEADNCPFAANPNQEDHDGDGIGDACDQDDDADGVPDTADNCPMTINADQANLDGDALGDACDPDDDNDGVIDTADNCPATANAGQLNSDADALGDACDPDDDNDTVLDGADNCPVAANTDQKNNDGDALGDVCDPDDDNDTVLDTADNCVFAPNTAQTDTDGDTQGDACDADDDNDSALDDADNCPLVVNPNQENNDGDAFGDACDPDDDNDTVLDGADNCTLVANADQLNSDGDTFGDACDPDDDNDTVLDAADNCPVTANPDQNDTDTDGTGDACDTDDDNDGVADTADNCALVANADQLNSDGDAIGDACDPDDDNDTVLDAADNCPVTANQNQANNDGDGQGDACDTDDDNDTVLDTADNCSFVANADQSNNDGDAQGDACDLDDDNDGVADTADNCALMANADQANADGDLLGNVCDPDDDNDGRLDGQDNCQFVANPNQEDFDGDGAGDACDFRNRPVVVAAATNVSENGETTLMGTITDPDANQTHTVTIEWGDGSPNSSALLAAGVTEFAATHRYLDDDPTSTGVDTVKIKVTVTDSGSDSAYLEPTLTVTNLAPVVAATAGTVAPIPLGGTATVSATITDDGSKDTHTCTFTWMDGATTTAPAAGGTCSSTFVYKTTGVFPVLVTVRDDDTGTATSRFDYIVVYDPNAGFVTGGGAIDSPAGAYAADSSVTGRAHFGFVSKYKKGQTVPTGETEFQFQVAGFNFHSAVYEWLVVAGAKAQFKGRGTVNGTGDYGFILTATDGQLTGGGGVDKFRIKIWDIESGVVVYDNVSGVAEDLESAMPQAITQGSIVIHTPKK